MSWSDTRERLLEAARRIRENKILDAATRALLAEIPIVDGFAANLWESIDADEGGRAEQLASLLETAARQEHEFKKLQALIEEQGETLLATRASTEDILRRVVGIEQKVGDLSARLDVFFAQLNVDTVSDALRASVMRPTLSAATLRFRAGGERRREHRTEPQKPG